MNWAKILKIVGVMLIVIGIYFAFGIEFVHQWFDFKHEHFGADLPEVPVKNRIIQAFSILGAGILFYGISSGLIMFKRNE